MLPEEKNAFAGASYGSFMITYVLELNGSRDYCYKIRLLTDIVGGQMNPFAVLLV